MWPSSMSALWTVDRHTMDSLGATHTHTRTHTHTCVRTHALSYRLQIAVIELDRFVADAVAEQQTPHNLSACILSALSTLQFWAFRKATKKKSALGVGDKVAWI